MIEVLNKRDIKDTFYWRDHPVDVCRPSPLGNPFKIGEDGTREEVIAKYERWLMMQHSDGVQWQTIASLTAVYKRSGVLRLACWCAPEACHADVIKRIIEERLE